MKTVKALGFLLLAFAAAGYAFWLRDSGGGNGPWMVLLGIAAAFLVASIKTGFMSGDD